MAKRKKAVAGLTECKHCRQKMTGKAKLVGLTFVCPFCGMPSGR